MEVETIIMRKGLSVVTIQTNGTTSALYHQGGREIFPTLLRAIARAEKMGYRIEI